MKNLFPPGEYIQDELKARDWKQDDLAQIIGGKRRSSCSRIC